MAFELIFKQPGTSRSDLVTLLSSTPTTVTRLLASMESQQLIDEQADKSGRRGPPIKQLFIRKGALYSAGINFTHNRLEVALVNFDGSWLDSHSEKIKKPTAEQIEDHALHALNDLLSKHNISKKSLIGIGVSVPGDFMADGHTITAHSYFPALKNLDIEKHFKQFFKLPIYIENDANCSALCELLAGVGRDKREFLSLYIGYGVSSGLAINHKLYRGQHGNAGLIGVQFPSFVNIRPSGQNLLEFLNRQDIHAKGFSELGKLYEENCEDINMWLDRAAAQLQEKLYQIARLLDLQAIIVGGRLPLNILQHLAKSVNAKTFAPVEDLLPYSEIVCTEMGARAGVYGAALIPIYRECFLHTD
ncbi:ROK family transcriptional regulator [Porticoccus sp. W117]|uniref:ROK family transcriptional regulator n=1 Tax=Porticoccus sp. W117 TaxID=3054777 RepID=UPI0025931B06|nr:ROK family transcriptional regulator [Porticoccus sp. W117]MDM3872212.1 ROK family transcriptional regulator [Porticoccus sp. W117]